MRGVTYKAAVDLHEELDDSSYVLLRANNIQDGELRFDDVQYVDRAKVKQKQLLRRGDILFCASSGSKGLVGKAALVRENMPVTFGAFCCVLRPKENEAEYLAHYFQSQQYRRAIEKVCSGSNINNLKAANFFSLVVPHYDNDSTRVISALFDSIDAQIKHAKDQIANLDSLVKSRFVEMFGDPVDGVLWAKQKLSDLYQVKSSKRIYAREQTKSGVPFLRLADVGSLIDSGMADSGLFISEERFEELKVRGQVPAPDDVLVTARGTLGRCYVIKPADHFYFQDGMITWLAASENSPLPSYLLAIFDNPHFIEQLSNNCSGTTVRYLSISDLANVTIPVAPLALQEEFASFASQVDKSRFVDLGGEGQVRFLIANRWDEDRQPFHILLVNTCLANSSLGICFKIAFREFGSHLGAQECRNHESLIRMKTHHIRLENRHFWNMRNKHCFTHAANTVDSVNNNVILVDAVTSALAFVAIEPFQRTVVRTFVPE